MNQNPDSEEQDILDQFERDALLQAQESGQEMAAARLAAHYTFKKTKRVNLRVSERDFNLAHSRAREEGMPYQTILSSVIHTYISGRLVERQLPDRPDRERQESIPKRAGSNANDRPVDRDKQRHYHHCRGRSGKETQPAQSRP